MRSRISSSLTTRRLRPSRCKVSSISFRLRDRAAARASRLHTVSPCGLLPNVGLPKRRRSRLDAAILARRQPISRPARSPIANGPIGMPNLVTTASTCSAARFDSISPPACRAAPACGLPTKRRRRQHGRHLCDAARHRDRRSSARPRGLFRAHDLAQLHHVGRTEEVHAGHVLRSSVTFAFHRC